MELLNDSTLNDWLTVEAAAKSFNLHPDHIRRLLRANRISGQKWGPVWMVSCQSLKAYLQQTEKDGIRRGRKPH